LFSARLHGGTVGRSVALQQEGHAFDSQPGVFLHGVCIVSPFMRGFSPGTTASSQSPKIQLPLGVNGCVHGCLDCVSLCCPAMDLGPVQGEPCISPVDCWR
ncbi:hypothetical protein ILYODFUR_026998, partial [Ilyodon furcidens]